MSEEQGEKQYESDQTASNRVGVTLSQSVEGNAIAEDMEQKEGVEVTHYPAMIRIDDANKSVFDLYDFEVSLGGSDELAGYD